ncbi:MAG: alpha/beta hydrolase [Burkholderiales bacterium]
MIDPDAKTPESLAARWAELDHTVSRLTQRFTSLYHQHSFEHVQPTRLQEGIPARLRKPYAVSVAYTDWGPADAPLVVCLGGVANTAMRFSFLAAELCSHWRVVCMDWLGRGRSGWLADDSEYGRATYVEQLRQLLDHLDTERSQIGVRPAPVVLIGSSLGGSVAIEFAATQPERVARLVLGDVGPTMPRARRRRRGETLARFYVFRTPEDLHRKVGAAQKNDGPVSEQIRQFIAYHQTRWSPEHGGRIYSHDLRALMAYRREAEHDLDQWPLWRSLRCPVLVMHGMESDALTATMLARMRRSHALTVAHVARTGHSPVLSDRHQTHVIAQWLQGDATLAADSEFSVLHAAPRQPWSAAQPDQPPINHPNRLRAPAGR